MYTNIHIWHCQHRQYILNMNIWLYKYTCSTRFIYVVMCTQGPTCRHLWLHHFLPTSLQMQWLTWSVPVDTCPLQSPLSLRRMKFHHPKVLTAICWILLGMTRLANMFPLNPHLPRLDISADVGNPCWTLISWSSPARAPPTKSRLPRNKKTKSTVTILTPRMSTAPWLWRKVLRMLHRNTPHFYASTGSRDFPRAAKTKANRAACTHTLTQHSFYHSLGPRFHIQPTLDADAGSDVDDDEDDFASPRK